MLRLNLVLRTGPRPWDAGPAPAAAARRPLFIGAALEGRGVWRLRRCGLRYAEDTGRKPDFLVGLPGRWGRFRCLIALRRRLIILSRRLRLLVGLAVVILPAVVALIMGVVIVIAIEVLTVALVTVRVLTVILATLIVTLAIALAAGLLVVTALVVGLPVKSALSAMLVALLAVIETAILLLLLKACIEHTIVMIRVLEIIFRGDAITHCTGIARHGEEFFHKLLRVAARSHVAAIEIGIAVRTAAAHGAWLASSTVIPSALSVLHIVRLIHQKRKPSVRKIPGSTTFRPQRVAWQGTTTTLFVLGGASQQSLDRLSAKPSAATNYLRQRVFRSTRLC